MASPHLWLVDDDPALGIIVGLLCRRAGQALTRFDAVEPAWEALVRGECPDLVLLDVNLPGHSGLELLRRMRERDDLRRVPVALFCQPGLSGDIAAGWAGGADFLLAKDLVTSPANWARRLGEILALVDGRDCALSLRWPLDENNSPPASWAQAVNQAIEHPALRPLGGSVQEQVIRRSLVAGLGRAPNGWVQPDGRLAVVSQSRPLSMDQVHRVMLSLLDQVRRLLGPEAADACGERLRAGWTASARQRG